MNIQFQSQKIQKLLENTKLLKKKYRDEIVKVIQKRMTQLQAVDNFADLFRLPLVPRMNIHRVGDFFAINISEKDRILIKPVITNPETQNLAQLETIDCVEIVDIGDYH